MEPDKDTFLTSNKRDFKWPMRVPITTVPAQPPIRNKPNGYIAQREEPYCHCDYHLYEPEMGRYKKMARKEMRLQAELDKVNKKLAILASDILDNPCDTDDEKMETIYQIHYFRKGRPVTKYTSLMAAVDSPVGIPIKGEVLGLGKAYVDPTKFRLSCFPKPRIDSAGPPSYVSKPSPLEAWFAPRTGTSEYNDSVSHMGLMLVKNRQQYKEPMPTSRRTTDDPCK